MLWESSYAEVGFREIFNNYIEKNYQHQINQWQLKKNYQQKRLVDALDSAVIGFSLGVSDSFPAGFFDFQSQRTQSESVGWNINKNFSKGINLNFSQRLVNYDLTAWSLTPPSPKPYEIENKLELEFDLGQNLLGIKRSLEKDFEYFQVELKQLELGLEQEEDLFQFFSKYLEVKKNISFYKLNKLAHANSLSRQKLIEKRQRDGLSRRVELYQSKLDTTVKNEDLIKSLIMANLSLNQLEDYTEKPYQVELLGGYNKSSKTLNEVEKFSLDQINQNWQIKRAIKSIEIAQVSHQRAKQQNFWDIKLKLSYSSNAIRSELNQTWNDARSARNYQRSAALNISTPLGMEQTQAQLAQEMANLKIAQYAEKKIQSIVRRQSQTLLDRLKLVNKILNQSKSRLELAQQAASEMQRLYNLAQAEFEQVLNAQDAVIAAEVSLIQIEVENEQLHAELAFMLGEIKQFLARYALMEINNE
jgi:hypothetical protein